MARLVRTHAAHGRIFPMPAAYTRVASGSQRDEQAAESVAELARVDVLSRARLQGDMQRPRALATVIANIADVLVTGAARVHGKHVWSASPPAAHFRRH